MVDSTRPAPRSALRARLALAALAGALAALGQAPVSLPFATLLGLAGLVHLVAEALTPRRAAALAWAGGTGYFAIALSWIVEPFFVDIARHGWMAPFALIGLAGGLALFWALASGLAHALAQGVWARAVAIAVLLTTAELARSYVLTGFPWALIGHAWIGWAPMHLAAWIGPIGLTFLTVLLPALAVAAGRSRGLAVVAVPFALLYGLGHWLGAQPVPVADDRPIVRLVQPNAAQHLKWDPAHRMTFFERQVAFTAAEADRRPELIVWPETSLPALMQNAGPALDQITEAAAGVPVVAGVQRLDGPDVYNSLIVLNGTGEISAIYDKHHLVPFGEYVPGGPMIEDYVPFAFAARLGVGYTPGPGAQLIDLDRFGTALPLICYEAIFPQDLHAAPGRADWLLQITNDAWFGQVSGPYQHLAQARLRAVEQGLPMVRVANTGVSAVIDARGSITAALPLGEAGFVDARLPAALPPTPYSRTGDWPASLLLFLAIAGFSIARARNRH